MKSMFQCAEAAGYPDGYGVATMRGAFLLRASVTPLATDKGAFVPEWRPTAHALVPSAGVQGVRKQHDSMTPGFQGVRKQDNNMALIAATGGTSGSHPDWDPV